MAANTVRSPAAIEMSVHVVRTFIRTRRTLAAQAELADELKKLKRGLAAKFGEYDHQFRIVFEAIERLISPCAPKLAESDFEETMTSRLF